MSIWRFVICLALIGIGLIFMGKTEFEQAAARETPPQLITCRQLQEVGQLDAPNILLSDFSSANGTVSQQSRHGAGWSSVFVPAFPRHEIPRPEDYRVILKVSASDDDELEKVLAKKTVEGQVGQSAEVLDAEARALLEEMYPGIQLDKCHLVEVGPRRPSRDTAVTFWTIAAGCLVGAVGCSFIGFRRLQGAVDASGLEAQQLETIQDGDEDHTDKF